MKPGVIIALLFLLSIQNCTIPIGNSNDQSLTENSLVGTWRLFDLLNNDSAQNYKDDGLLKAAKNKKLLKREW